MSDRPPFAYVQQRGRNDCGVAAMAMFGGYTYEQMSEVLIRRYPQYTLGEATPLCVLLGALTECCEFPVMTHYINASRPALLCVTSPIDPMYGHAVYWDGKRVWDPSPAGPHVTKEWLDAHCYGQIQRVRDLVGIAGSRTRVEVRAALRQYDEFPIPGDRQAA